MRRPSALPAATVAVAALMGATSATPQAAAQSTGGARYGEQPLTAPTFAIAPAAVAPGATLTVRYRIAGRPRRVRVRIDLLPESGGGAAATLRLGRRPTNRDLTATWRPTLQPGRYTARLRATAPQPKPKRTARASGSSTVEVVAPPVAASSGVFPVQGPYSLGGEAARFGARREGHTHQGQDIVAAAGTPIVAPRAAFVSWRAYQADGAGHYVVLHGDDARDYVFMHLQTGSVAVQKGQAVAAGSQIGAVGSTGHSDGPHLHFEIWPDGWYASKSSKPIDPLPDLLAWAAAG